MPLKKLTQAEINQRFEAVKDLMKAGYTGWAYCEERLYAQGFFEPFFANAVL